MNVNHAKFQKSLIVEQFQGNYLKAIEGIPDKDYNFLGNENFYNLYERLPHERKLKSGYLEGRIYERPLHLRENLLPRIKADIFQNYLYTMYINLL